MENLATVLRIIHLFVFNAACLGYGKRYVQCACIGKSFQHFQESFALNEVYLTLRNNYKNKKNYLRDRIFFFY